MIASTLIVVLLALTAPAERAQEGEADRRDEMLARMRGESAAYDRVIDARMRDDAAAYIAEVEAAITAINTYNPQPRSWQDIQATLDRLGDWAGLISLGGTHRLDAAQEERRATLLTRLSRMQVRLLPRLRYAVSDAGEFRDGVSCYTTADSRVVAVCSAERFQRSTEILRFQNSTRNLMRQLRLRQVVYQPHAARPSRYFSQTFDMPPDSVVLLWEQSGQYRPVG